MMRGGHLDVCVLGAFQVSGDRRPRQLAHRRARRDPGRRRRDGPRDRREGRLRDDDALRQARRAKLVPACTYPLTGVGCVSRVYTDLATFDLAADGVVVRRPSAPRSPSSGPPLDLPLLVS